MHKYHGHYANAQDSRPSWEPKPYTQAQADLIKLMMSERDITAEQLRQVFPSRPSSAAEASKVIDWLKGQTKTVSGRTSAQKAKGVDLRTYKQGGKRLIGINYALREEDGTVKFYRVKPGRKEGFFFVDIQASDDLYPIKAPVRKQAILDRISADPEAALALYGQEIGACGRCGRTLTSEYRKLGIGPECIKK